MSREQERDREEFPRVESVAVPEAKRLDKYLDLRVENPPRKIVNPTKKEVRQIIWTEETSVKNKFILLVGQRVLGDGQYYRSSNVMLFRNISHSGMSFDVLQEQKTDHDQFDVNTLHETIHSWAMDQEELIKLENEQPIIAYAVHEGMACVGSEYIINRVVEEEMVPLFIASEKENVPRMIQEAREHAAKASKDREVSDDQRAVNRELIQEYNQLYNEYVEKNGLDAFIANVKFTKFRMQYESELSSAISSCGRDFVQDVVSALDAPDFPVGIALELVANNPPNSMEELLDVELYLGRVSRG